MKIMITSRSFGKINDEPRKKLENAGFEIVMKMLPTALRIFAI